MAPPEQHAVAGARTPRAFLTFLGGVPQGKGTLHVALALQRITTTDFIAWFSTLTGCLHAFACLPCIPCGDISTRVKGPLKPYALNNRLPTSIGYLTSQTDSPYFTLLHMVIVPVPGGWKKDVPC